MKVEKVVYLKAAVGTCPSTRPAVNGLKVSVAGMSPGEKCLVPRKKNILVVDLTSRKCLSLLCAGCSPRNQSVSLSVYLAIYLSVHQYVFICISICLSVYISVIPICLSVLSRTVLHFCPSCHCPRDRFHVLPLSSYTGTGG